MALDPAHLRFFAEFIESRAGIVYSESNFYQLERRLEEIATHFGLADPGELYRRAVGGIHGPFHDLLLDVATNNETSFFRDSGVFRALEETILPTVFRTVGGRRPIRVWSAAASTGQEAYSLAMTLESMRARGVSVPEYSILGTDISERVLKRASEGAYSQLEAQRGLGARQLIQFFDKRGESTWAVKESLRRRVRFAPLNLLGPWSGLPPFDLVLCRNVLIYQSIANKARVLRKIHDQLAPGGILVLGATETMLGLDERSLFADERVPGAFFFRKPT